MFRKIWNRMFENPKTTLGGFLHGGLFLAMFEWLKLELQKHGCDVTVLLGQIEWASAIPVIVGALTTDNGKSDVVGNS